MLAGLRCLALALVASYGVVAFTPCQAPRRHDPAAHHAQAQMPCEHEAAPVTLTAPCPCGCGDAGPALAGAAVRLGSALLLEPPAFGEAARSPRVAAEAAHLPAAPGSAIDHVPLFA